MPEDTLRGLCSLNSFPHLVALLRNLVTVMKAAYSREGELRGFWKLAEPFLKERLRTHYFFVSSYGRSQGTRRFCTDVWVG
jgi:hypothetical protein